MEAHIFIAHNKLCKPRLHNVVFSACLIGLLSTATAQVLQTPASEEQRRRGQADAAERARQAQAPHVVLSPAVDVPDTFSLPVETPCFDIKEITLTVPSQLSPATQLAGASDLPLDPFWFAQNYLLKYSGKCIGVQGVNVIVQRLTALFAQKGYSTTRIGIPEQDFATGVMQLTLIPGMIRTIRFSDPTLYGTWRNAFPTGDGRLLNLRDLEQGLEQMKKVASQDVEMHIVPAEVPGESDIVLDVKRGKPYTIGVNYDNTGSKSTGQYQAGINLGMDNLLGLSDTLNLGISSDANRQGGAKGTGGHSLYYAVPAGYWNYSVSASDYDYHQKIAGNNQDYVSSGKSQNLEFKVSQLFQRDQSQKNRWQFKVSKRWSDAFIDDTEIGVQKRNTTALELAWLHTHYLGNAQLDFTFAQRWGSPLFGAQSNPEGRSSDYPSFMYSMQVIDATLTAPFNIAEQPLTYIATFHGQNTRSALYLTDQFVIGNRYTVRGFDGELTLAGERGFYLRNELNMPLADSGQSAYIGLDVGKVYGPSVQDLIGDKLAGAAIGLRGGYRGFAYEAFASWALYKPEDFTSATPAVGFSLGYQY